MRSYNLFKREERSHMLASAFMVAGSLFLSPGTPVRRAPPAPLPEDRPAHVESTAILPGRNMFDNTYTPAMPKEKS